MSPVLELEVDKFRFRFPDDLLYGETGVWVRLEGNRARVGLSDFTQQRNGDVAFAQAKEAGAAVRRGEELAVVETIKVNVSVPSPVDGRVVETNGELFGSPELVNRDPYGRGWLAVLEVEDAAAGAAGLRTAADYLPLAKAEAEAEAIR